MASVGRALMNPITTLKNLFLAFKTSMAVTFVVDMTKNLMSMMASVGRAVLNPIATLRKLFTTFRVFMTATFIPGMIAALSGMLASIGGLLTAMAPILIPILAIAAVFALIGLALANIRDSLGFTSIFDVIMLGVAHLKDAFAHVVNAIGSIVNFIFSIVEGIASFIGFDVELPKVPKMSTDNAERKRAELDLKAEAARVEAEAEAERERLSAEGTGTDLVNDSTDNALDETQPPVTVVAPSQNIETKQNNNKQNNITVMSRSKTSSRDDYLASYLAYSR